jgi:hypothetical protein
MALIRVVSPSAISLCVWDQADTFLPTEWDLRPNDYIITARTNSSVCQTSLSLKTLLKSMIKDEPTRETTRRQNEAVDRLRNALRNKRHAVAVGARATFSAAADASGEPLSRIIWTRLIKNELDYLVNDGRGSKY